jgi:hypothetical protein
MSIVDFFGSNKEVNERTARRAGTPKRGNKAMCSGLRSVRELGATQTLRLSTTTNSVSAPL